MTDSDATAVLGFGLATAALGDSAAQLATIAAGRPLYERHPRWVGRDGQRQIMCWAPGLEDYSDYPSRVALLLQRAWAECRAAEADKAHLAGDRARMIVVLPLTVGHFPGMRASFDQMAARLNFAGLAEIRYVFGEHAAGLGAFSQARQWLKQDPKHPVYLAAADCWCAPVMLDALAAMGILRDRNNPWSPIPSEGAVCLKLSLPDPGTPTILVRNHGHAIEEVRLADPSRGVMGRGLAQAAQKTLMLSCDIARIYSDAGAERWRAEELGVALSALMPAASDWPLVSPMQAVGEIGAASSLLAVVLASQQPGTSLVLSSERGGIKRAALVEPI